MTVKYQDVVTEITEVAVEGLTLRVEGMFWFTLAPEATAESACEQITLRGKQLAVLIKADQRLEDIAFRNGKDWIAYTPSDTVARECVAGLESGPPEYAGSRFGLGEPAGDRWVGFELAPGMTIIPESSGAGRMGYGFRFTLENFRTRFQVIPVLHACRDLPIARYHVVSAVVVRTNNPRISCSVDSTAEERST
jgi:hypothetical protein